MAQRPMSDDDTESETDDTLKTTEEEKWGTVPQSPYATAAALLCTTSQANPTVERRTTTPVSPKPKTNTQTGQKKVKKLIGTQKTKKDK